jgi:uncharacterized protein (TIGR01777 family)
MDIIITGGLGFVGSGLSGRLLTLGHRVTAIGRSPEPKPGTPEKITYLSADTALTGGWQEEIDKQQVIVNLAGESIFCRWNEKAKKKIYDSRILTTRNIVEAMGRNQTLINASAVGYYGFRGDEEISEKTPPGDDFLARVCQDWEKEAERGRTKGARVALARFGIVLGKKGGALGQMVPAFKRFVGGPLGSGGQWFSWIHMADLINGLIFFMDKPELEGPFNLCAPNPVRNKDLAKTLGQVLSRPSFFPTPAVILRLILGEFGSVLLKGQRVIPKRLQENGFRFLFPQIGPALGDLIG